MRVMDGPRNRRHKARDGGMLQTARGFASGAFARGNPKLPVTDPFIEADSFHQLHGEIMLPLMNAHFENWKNMWMIELGSGFGLNLKSLHDIGRSQFARTCHFERDKAIEAELPRLIDNAHPPAANFLK